MTKKSLSRVRKDNFKAGNTAWDDMRNIYLENQSGLNAVVNSVQKFFSIENIHLFIEPGTGDHVVGVVKGLATDVGNFQTRLNDIYRKHKDKTGAYVHNEADPGEYVRMIGIADEYAQYTQQYNTILEPIYRQALGIMATIEQKVFQIANQANQEGQADTTEKEKAIDNA